MKLFNTLTQSLEDFTPINDPVCIYVCGVTPYDTTHLGHAFTYLSFDTLIRYLEYSGYAVKYVQNVTDIDDDVLRKARELGMEWDELGRRETARFLADMDALGVRRPDVYARATDEIPRIIEIARALVERGYAYVSEGCVFYSVKQDAEFGTMAQAIGLDDYQSTLIRPANPPGIAPGDLAGPVGILNAAVCRCTTLLHRSISMAAARTWPSHTIPVRSPNPSTTAAWHPSHASGCTPAWSIRTARK